MRYMSRHACCVLCSAGVLAQLREEGVLSGWRNELYPVPTSFHAEPLALVERAAAVHLGIKAYGVHVNGYVETERGVELWVATRSQTKPTWPGRLDHIVAGGQVSPCTLCYRYSCSTGPQLRLIGGLPWSPILTGMGGRPPDQLLHKPAALVGLQVRCYTSDKFMSGISRTLPVVTRTQKATATARKLPAFVTSALLT